MDLMQRIETILRKLLQLVAKEIERQVEKFAEDLRHLLYDIFNYPPEREWRESLAIFERYWEPWGITLTPAARSTLERLITSRLAADGNVHAQQAATLSAVAQKEAPLPAAPKAPSPSVEERAHAREQKRQQERLEAFRKHAKTLARHERERLKLSHAEQEQIEAHFLENMLRTAWGIPPADPPEFWIQKDYEWRERLKYHEQADSVRGITAQEARASELQWKYNNLSRLSPQEQEELITRATREAKIAYLEEHGWSPLAILMAFLNPAFDGTGTLNDAATIAMPFVPGPATPKPGPMAFPSRPPGHQGRRPLAKFKPPSKPPLPPPVAKVRVSIRERWGDTGSKARSGGPGRGAEGEIHSLIA